MSEKNWLKEIQIKYPNQKARETADDTVDLALFTDPYASLISLCGVWNDTYLSMASANFKKSKGHKGI